MPSVLLVTHDLQRAGAQRQCVELALGLARRSRWGVEVATLEPDGPLATELREAGVPLHTCQRRWRWDLSPATHLTSLVRRKGHDVVHSFMFLPNFYARVAGLVHRPSALVSSLRSARIAGWHRFIMEVLMAPLCDCIIANSKAGRDALLACGVAPWRVVVVRNGLDLNRFNAARRSREENPPTRGCRVSMVARMEASRDHEGLIEAMALVRKQHPGARLILAGDGTRRPRVEEAVRKAGLGQAVEIVGAVDHPERIYPTLDIYVQASAVMEGTSNSIIEAMASGRPVVATDLGGNREVVVHGETGLLVPPRDPEALAGAILALLQDPDRAVRLGAAGAERASALYSREVMVKATLEVYEALLRSGVAASRQRPDSS